VQASVKVFQGGICKVQHSLSPTILGSISREQAIEFDRKTIVEVGIPGVVLMENAGSKAAELLMKANQKREPTLILCGKGNNGGDGMVIGRYLYQHGFPLRLVLLCDPKQLKDEAAIQWKIMQSIPIDRQAIDPQTWKSHAADWERFPVHVDALFGTGLSSPMRAPFPDLLQWWNDTSAFKVALDLPSGLCANTGKGLPVSLKANQTYTFIAPKNGFYLNDGPDHVGEVRVIDIGIPRFLFH
jgi:hydroxyethylthiazole kinase-like uncharacterized protein yjeF